MLKVARDAAGFTPGQGEVLRRALGSKHAPALLEGLREAFVQGAIAKGIGEKTAHAIFDSLAAFGSYSFPKSHAAAFAVLVYQSAWLKRRHPAAFLAALLNNQPMGFWSPSVLVNDARRHGLAVLPVDVNRSGARCAPDGARAIRLDLGYVKGFGEASVGRLLDARQRSPFAGLADLCRRTRLPRRLVENLVAAGACDAWGVARRKLLWDLGTLSYQEEMLDLVFDDVEVPLPPLGALEKLGMEVDTLGLTTGPHPVELYRAWLDRQGILHSAALRVTEGGKRVRVAGLVVVHQSPPTAKGHHFLTLEDEHGLMDVVMRPNVYDRFHRVLRESPLLVVEGVVQRSKGIVVLIAGRVGRMPG